MHIVVSDILILLLWTYIQSSYNVCVQMDGSCVEVVLWVMAGCVRPALGSNPGASQFKMETFNVDNFATDPAYILLRKSASIAVS